jgi:hypothetical protein
MRSKVEHNRSGTREAARSPSLSARMRCVISRASGITGVRSGSVNVSTVAPRSIKARCIASMSRATAAASKRRAITSFVPENTVARSGSSSSAGASCRSRIWRVVRPRTPKFAYASDPCVSAIR